MELAQLYVGTTMTSTARPRGRPKGTGIDDSKTLRDVLNLLASEDGLRPTTAIHRAGISDPSVVRRLREKLKLVPAVTAAPELIQNVSRRARQRTRVRTMPAQKPVAPTPTIPIQQPPQPQDTRATASPEPISTETEPSAGESPRRKPRIEPELTVTPPSVLPTYPVDPQIEALRLSAEASAAMSRLFLHCITFSAQTNPLSLALRSQTIMSEFFASMLTGKAMKKPE
jgi:hypothetical protein